MRQQKARQYFGEYDEIITRLIEKLKTIVQNFYMLFFKPKIGLALIKETSESNPVDTNLLIKRYTLEIEDLNESSALRILNDSNELVLSEDEEWEFRDSILKCLWSKEFQYSSSKYI